MGYLDEVDSGIPQYLHEVDSGIPQEQGANARIEGISCPVEHCRFILAHHCHGEYTITNSLLIETSKKKINMCSQSLPNPLSNPDFQSSPILYLLSPQLFTNP